MWTCIALKVNAFNPKEVLQLADKTHLRTRCFTFNLSVNIPRELQIATHISFTARDVRSLMFVYTEFKLV